MDNNKASPKKNEVLADQVIKYLSEKNNLSPSGVVDCLEIALRKARDEREEQSAQKSESIEDQTAETMVSDVVNKSDLIEQGEIEPTASLSNDVQTEHEAPELKPELNLSSCVVDSNILNEVPDKLSGEPHEIQNSSLARNNIQNQPAFPKGTAAPDRIKRVSLPNAIQDGDYAVAMPFKGKDLSLVSVKSNGDEIDLVKTGLEIDLEELRIKGIPLLNGDVEIELKSNTLAKTRIILDLYINPNPNNLWKDIPPPSKNEAEYWKANTDTAKIISDEFEIFAASRRGRSHAHVGSFRDDDFNITQDDINGWCLLTVADGAGSAKYSREGSRIAVSAFKNHVMTQLASQLGTELIQSIENARSEDQSTKSNALSFIQKEIWSLFQNAAVKVVESIENAALSKNEKARSFATTLLVALIKKVGKNTFVSTLWIGDGGIAIYQPDEQNIQLMGVPDSGEFAGQTRFIDWTVLKDQGFYSRINFKLIKNFTSLMLMTDGVSDPYFEVDEALMSHEKWDALWSDVSLSLRGDEPEKELLDWLNFLKPGYHDDRTIVVLLPNDKKQSAKNRTEDAFADEQILEESQTKNPAESSDSIIPSV